MDTCCFGNYCAGCEQPFNYKSIRQYVKENGIRVAITPYTFYECIQNCDTPEKIQRQKAAFKAAGDFWIINVNKLLDGTRYCKSFLSEWDFDNTEAFIKQKDEWGRKVYATLEPRFILLAQIIAATYLIITETNKDGIDSRNSLAKLRIIEEVFSHHDAYKSQFISFTETPSYYLFRDQKKAGKTDFKQYLLGYLQNMALLMITIAEAVLVAIKNNQSEILMPYVHPISIQPGTRKLYARRKMVGRYITYKNQSTQGFSVEALIDQFLSDNNRVAFPGFFKEIARQWFTQREYGGGEIPNFIIDYVNLGVLEAGSGLPLIYITEEKSFVKLIKQDDDECLSATKEFYKEFYNRKDIE